MPTPHQPGDPFWDWEEKTERSDVEVSEGGGDNERDDALGSRRKPTDGGNDERNGKTNYDVRENEEVAEGGSQLKDDRNDPQSTDGSPQPISAFLTEEQNVSRIHELINLPDTNKSKNESDDEDGDELNAVRPILDGKHILSQGQGCQISRVSPDAVVQCLHASENQMIGNNTSLGMRLVKYKSYENPFIPAMSLAESGFIPLDQESSTDAVVCVWCGLTLKDFTEHVDAIAIHQTYSYNCQYLRQLTAKEREGQWQLANYDMVLKKPAVRSTNVEDGSLSLLTTSVQSATSLVPDVARLQDMSDLERYKFFVENISANGVPNADHLMSKWERSSQSHPYFDDSSAAILKAHGITWIGEHLLRTQCPFHIDLNQESPMVSVDEVITQHAELRNDKDQPCLRSRGMNGDHQQLKAIGMLQLLGVNTDFSKHSEFAVTDRRLATFLTYPYGNGQSRDELAEAGYFYSGDGDGVTCFSCGVVSSNWLTTEVPWQRHARSSPSCQYLAVRKGKNFASQVIEQMGYYTPEEPENRINTITTRMLRPRMESPAVQGTLARGLERSKVRDVVSRRIQRGETDFRYTADIVKAVHDLDVPSTVHINQPKLPSHELPAREDRSITEQREGGVEDPDNGEMDQGNRNPENGGFNALGGRQPLRTLGRDADPLAALMTTEAFRTVSSQLTCKVCLSDIVGISFLPCGHLVCCIACAAAMVQCPLCRRDINGTVKVNMPQE